MLCSVINSFPITNHCLIIRHRGNMSYSRFYDAFIYWVHCLTSNLRRICFVFPYLCFYSFIYLFIYYHYYYFIFFTIFVSWKIIFSTLKTHKTFNIIARYYSRQNTFRNCLLRVCLVKNCWQILYGEVHLYIQAQRYVAKTYGRIYQKWQKKGGYLKKKFKNASKTL